MNKRILYILGGSMLVLAVVAVSLSLGTQLTRQGTSVGNKSLLANMGMGTAGVASESSFYAFDEAAAPMMDGRDMMMDSFAPEPFPSPTAGQTAADVDQKIIKNGSLRLVVDDVSEATAAITTLAGAEEGFVQHSSVSERADGTHVGSITIRVPSSRFEAVIQSIKAVANVVETESVSGQDVTEQFTDLQAQLRNAEAQEATFLAVLDRATTVEDILNVQRELGYIRAQIESLQGRMQYLENVTSYSTIDVSLSEEPSLVIPSKEFRPLTSVKEAAQALVVIGQQFVIGFIWLVIVGGGLLLPTALFLSLLVWLLLKLVKRMRARR